MSVLNIIGLVLVPILVSSSVIDRRTTGQVCHNSYECSSNTCCRTVNGDLVTTEMMGPFGPPSGGHQSGMCNSTLGALNDVCDSNCGCQTGLECYRQMSGICCTPMRCFDATYVQKQREYWQKCMQDPHCALPP